MSWTAVAKKDFRDARRSKTLWGATGIFLVFVAGVVVLDPAEGSDAGAAMASMVGIGTFLLPLPVLVMAYRSITGEVESGRLKNLLVLPTTRREVVFGKLVGRTLATTLAIFVALAVGAVLLFGQFGDVPVAEYAKFVLATLYFTVVWIGIAVGISAMSDTRGKALAGTLGVYFVFTIVWTIFSPQSGVATIVEDVLGLSPTPALYDFVLTLSPAYAYSVIGNVFARGIAFTGDAYVGSYGGDFPFYLQGWFVFVVLFAWLAVPVLLGYRQFRTAEIS